MEGRHIHIVGWQSELKAQLLLSEQGYEVFTPSTPNTRADMLALCPHTGAILKVQVKTVQLNGAYLQSRITIKERHYTPEEVDLFVFIYQERSWSVPASLVLGRSTVNFGREDGQPLIERKDLPFHAEEYENV